MEYELEWESAFNLHIKIAPVTSLTCAWAGSDRVVFIKTVRMLFKKLWEDGRTSGDMSNTSRLVACGKEVTCIDYQVKSITEHSCKNKDFIQFLPYYFFLTWLWLLWNRFDFDFSRSFKFSSFNEDNFFFSTVSSFKIASSFAALVACKQDLS